MSRRNGDRAKFHKDRHRKMLRRRRTRVLAAALLAQVPLPVATRLHQEPGLRPGPAALAARGDDEPER